MRVPQQISLTCTAQTYITCPLVVDTVGALPDVLSLHPYHLQFTGQIPSVPWLLPQQNTSLSLTATSGVCSACVWARLEMPEFKFQVATLNEWGTRTKTLASISWGGKFWVPAKVCSSSNSQWLSGTPTRSLALGGLLCFPSHTVTPTRRFPGSRPSKQLEPISVCWVLFLG